MHAKQVSWAALPWYCPAVHAAHATVGCALYFPVTHAVQVLAPLDASVSVTKPARHTWHGDVDTEV